MFPETARSEEQMDALERIVRKYWKIEDITLGTHKDKYFVRYRGRLLQKDTVAAYDRLAADLHPLNYTPLFRWDGERHALLLLQGIAPVPKFRPMINLVMFIATLLSVWLTGALYSLQGELPAEPLQSVVVLIREGWPFALSMLGILAAHEFGHYFAGRLHGVALSLPYFIPLPLISPFGTMGAFINMKSPPKNRRALLDLGIAGPLAGLIVAIPVLIIGLMLSKFPDTIQAPATGSALSLEGNSLLYLTIKYLVFGQLLPTPASYGGVAPVIYWIQYFFTGTPFPIGGTDVLLGAVAWAGWGGLLVTAINLLPAGQLDGGHILYVMFGSQITRKVFPFIIIFLAVLGFAWQGWWLWVFLVFLFGRQNAEPLDTITELGTGRKLLGALMLLVMIVTFIPVPLNLIM